MKPHPDCLTALPGRLRLLCVDDSEPPWTALALVLAEYGCTEPQFRWCVDAGEAAAFLREEPCDCAILNGSADGRPVDPAAFLEALDVGGTFTPVLVLTDRCDDDRLPWSGRLECEYLLTNDGWNSRLLPRWVARTMQRARLVLEHQRFSTADHRRMSRERDETELILEQQRRIAGRPPVEPSEHLSVAPAPGEEPLPEEITRFYQELLRTYIIMGAGNLAEEIRKLAEALALAGVRPRAVLGVHLERVESMVRGLGSRSSRHVMSRADILAMELMIELAECYRRKSRLQGLGDFGVDLLHAATLRSKAGFDAGPSTSDGA